jgi:hypothetical protein
VPEPSGRCQASAKSQPAAEGRKHQDDRGGRAQAWPAAALAIQHALQPAQLAAGRLQVPRRGLGQPGLAPKFAQRRDVPCREVGVVDQLGIGATRRPMNHQGVQSTRAPSLLA